MHQLAALSCTLVVFGSLADGGTHHANESQSFAGSHLHQGYALAMRAEPSCARYVRTYPFEIPIPPDGPRHAAARHEYVSRLLQVAPPLFWQPPSRLGLGGGLWAFVSAFLQSLLSGRALVVADGGGSASLADLLCSAFECRLPRVDPRWVKPVSGLRVSLGPARPPQGADPCLVRVLRCDPPRPKIGLGGGSAPQSAVVATRPLGHCLAARALGALLGSEKGGAALVAPLELRPGLRASLQPLLDRFVGDRDRLLRELHLVARDKAGEAPHRDRGRRHMDRRPIPRRRLAGQEEGARGFAAALEEGAEEAEEEEEEEGTDPSSEARATSLARRSLGRRYTVLHVRTVDPATELQAAARRGAEASRRAVLHLAAVKLAVRETGLCTFPDSSGPSAEARARARRKSKERSPSLDAPFSRFFADAPGFGPRETPAGAAPDFGKDEVARFKERVFVTSDSIELKRELAGLYHGNGFDVEWFNLTEWPHPTQKGRGQPATWPHPTAAPKNEGAASVVDEKGGSLASFGLPRLMGVVEFYRLANADAIVACRVNPIYPSTPHGAVHWTPIGGGLSHFATAAAVAGGAQLLRCEGKGFGEGMRKVVDPGVDRGEQQTTPGGGGDEGGGAAHLVVLARPPPLPGGDSSGGGGWAEAAAYLARAAAALEETLGDAKLLLLECRGGAEAGDWGGGRSGTAQDSAERLRVLEARMRAELAKSKSRILASLQVAAAPPPRPGGFQCGAWRAAAVEFAARGLRDGQALVWLEWPRRPGSGPKADEGGGGGGGGGEGGEGGVVGSAMGLGPYELTTFSHGVHLCPGQRYALVLVELLAGVCLDVLDLGDLDAPQDATTGGGGSELLAGFCLDVVVPPLDFTRATLAQRRPAAKVPFDWAKLRQAT